MTTREEIEAAVDVVRRYNGVRESSPYAIADEFGQQSILAALDLVNRSQETLADAYLAERQQRERDQQPPTQEMFERLCTRQPESMGWNYLRWWNSAPCPVWWDGVHDIDSTSKTPRIRSTFALRVSGNVGLSPDGFRSQVAFVRFHRGHIHEHRT